MVRKLFICQNCEPLIKKIREISQNFIEISTFFQLFWREKKNVSQIQSYSEPRD
jgi:hypothetical protein